MMSFAKATAIVAAAGATTRCVDGAQTPQRDRRARFLGDLVRAVPRRRPLDVTDRRTLAAWLSRQRVDWPQVWDARGYDSPLAEQFGVTAPAHFFHPM